MGAGQVHKPKLLAHTKGLNSIGVYVHCKIKDAMVTVMMMMMIMMAGGSGGDTHLAKGLCGSVIGCTVGVSTFYVMYQARVTKF